MAGVVQGVGFRPFVHRLATELGLAGHVGNDTEGVFVEVEGAVAAVADSRPASATEAPPLARIFRVEATAVEARRDERGFGSSRARPTGAVRTFVSPDVAVCDDCLAELFDPADRRFRYPFINCTNCGPRFTITLRLPYDRPNTTMRRLRAVRRLRRRVRRPGGPSLPRPARGLCRTAARGCGSKGPTGVVDGTDAAIAADPARRSPAAP